MGAETSHNNLARGGDTSPCDQPIHKGCYHQKAYARPRTGHRWTTDEIQQLKDELAQGMTVYEIARAHQRTPTAIKMRVAEITLGQ